MKNAKIAAKIAARIAAPALVAAAFCAAPALAQPGAFGEKILIHGNYCGPGNNAPLPPIDALDAACARHDACTPDGGLPSKACNLRLQREATLISRDPREPDDLRALAGIVAAATPLIPSDPRPAPTVVSVGAPPDVYAADPRLPEPPADEADEADGPDAD